MVKKVGQATASRETFHITAVEAEAMARAVVSLIERWKLGDSVAREMLGGCPREHMLAGRLVVWVESTGILRRVFRS